ncbi:hypothetical protein PI124_g11196 [Phytophthora idaei]|nr:hypothetical protein PI125_g2918 [Phytophthora idaei]KAG3164402.1 hypothetical protein PI126_g5106 [Phytophthora idaei]KAG3244006.1 hypothetical protein PI124_g11196 [Phytophthora idaei]
MKAKMLLGLGAVAAVLMLGPGVNGLTTERGKGLRYLEDQRPVEVTAQLPGLLNEEGEDTDASASGDDSDGSDSDDKELAEGNDTSADCRPGTSYWPACRSIGYSECMPGVVRWPQCKNDNTRG